MTPQKMLLKKDIKEIKELVNIEIDRFLPRKDEYPKQIHKAIRHTLFAGGKRLRPYLLINVYKLFDNEIKKILPVASAIEMLHTYTLIHDDLPSIDNDDYRRGKKSCHVLYGEDIALLAGDALLVYAFESLSHCEIDDALVLQMIREMAQETGKNGLIAGQMADIKFEGKKVTEKTLKFIHTNKTAKLLTLPIRFACYLAGVSNDELQKLELFGEKIGLAFQIIDDVLDVEGSQNNLGKTIGKDTKLKKVTYPSIYGLEKSKEMAEQLVREAKEILEPYGEKAEILNLLSDFILTRKF